MSFAPKFRGERDSFAIDFSDSLDDGETITVTSLVVETPNGGVDKTSEFRDGEDEPTVEDALVSFWLDEADVGEQNLPLYAIRLEVETSTGRQIIACASDGQLPTLEVLR